MELLRTIPLTIALLTAGCIVNKRVINTQNAPTEQSPDRNNPGGDGTTPPTTPLSTPSTGSTTGSSTDKCYDAGIADGDQSIDYYTFRTVIGAGLNNGDTSAVQWSSALHLGESSGSTGAFVSESRVYIRILAKPAPGTDTARCKYQHVYNKLSMVIGIWGANSTGAAQELTFDDVSKNECSKVLRYTTIPNNSGSAPFQLKIRDVKWDRDCTYHRQDTEGCDSSIFRPVWTNNCWQIELHMATDETKDIPR